MTADSALIADLRAGLAVAGDPDRVAGAQAYLKSTMPMRGVRMGDLRRVTRGALAERPLRDRASWQDTVLELWDGARFREERYAALEVAGHRSARAWQDPDVLPLYRHLVVSGAWWDLVDGVATHLVGGVLRTYPDEVAPIMRAWAVDDDLWVRRTAVLSQVGAGDTVDLDLLTDCLEPNLERSEFWLRKACGWALRVVAPRDPQWVRGFVAAHRDRMSGLTLREATRRLPPDA